MKKWARLLPLIFLVSVLNVSADDYAAALRYAQWAKEKTEAGLWSEALAGLERAADFTDVSSDISYLLALARTHENRPIWTIFEALDRALAVDRFSIYGRDDCRLLMAETLISVKAYAQALSELFRGRRSPREAELILISLKGMRNLGFRPFLTETLDRYPREPGPVRIFFAHLKAEVDYGLAPRPEDLELLDLVIRRLPALLLRDKDLAWIAAPFMRDTEEAKRLVMAYRAVNEPVPASLPVALKLGVIDEETAVEELFAYKSNYSLDIALLGEIWELLRYENAKNAFNRNLLGFTGVITEDANRDGIPENTVEYVNGQLLKSVFDAAQGGVPDLVVNFEGGEPRHADTLVPPLGSAGVLPVKVLWERYPSLLEAELDGVKYIYRPFDFHYAPFLFENLFGSGLLFPGRDPSSPDLNRRLLVLSALRVERPSMEFNGGLEVVELNQGIPIRAVEYFNNQMISETEFLRGRPQIQRVDLDLDGRMETARFFKHEYRSVELDELWNYDRNIDYSVSDWDWDGIFEMED